MGSLLLKLFYDSSPNIGRERKKGKSSTTDLSGRQKYPYTFGILPLHLEYLSFRSPRAGNTKVLK
jgi:hypothetical protein